MNIRPLLVLILGLVLASAQARDEPALPEQIARELRIPRLEFVNATVREAVEFLRHKAKDLLGERAVLNLNYVGRGEIDSTHRVNCSLIDTPLLEILQIIAYEEKLTLGATANGLYLYPPGELPPETNGLREIGWNPGKIKLLGTAIYATGQKDAFSEAAKVLEDSYGGDRFKAPKEVRDAIDALRKRAEESDKRAREFNAKFQKEDTAEER